MENKRFYLCQLKKNEMAKIIINTPSPASAAALRDALNNPVNAYDAVTAAQNTVEIVINNRTDAALDLLAAIVTAQPWYLPGSGGALGETLKHTAQIVDGKNFDMKIAQATGDYSTIPTTFAAASIYVAPVRRDPLVLVLDGDGIETLAINATTPVMFDLDNSGVKKSVGWIKADDGFLVLDRNGNGTIDTGAELFGDATPLSGGGLAADGFDALAQLDTNLDGQMIADDSAFANLRVWRDLNQEANQATWRLAA